MLQETHSDAELMGAFDAMLSEAKGFAARDIAAVKAELQAQMRALQRGGSRPPGGFGEPNAGDVFNRRPSAGLAQNAAFQEFVGSSIKRRHFACELPFEVKAVTPVSGVGLPTPYGVIYGPPTPALRVAPLMFHASVETGAVVFTTEKTFTPAADLVPETTLKPATNMTFANTTLPVVTVANIAKASVQALRDTAALMNWIDSRLSYAALLRQEQYLLNDPTTGLLALAQPLATLPTGATALDAVAVAAGQLTVLGYVPDGVILNPNDVTNARLLKNTLGDYLWSAPSGTVGTSSMWSLPLVESPSMPSGSFLVGAFSESTILFDRQILTVEISYENEDDFINNLACFRAELRFALGVPLPNGLVKGAVPAGSLAAHNGPQTQHPVKK